MKHLAALVISCCMMAVGAGASGAGLGVREPAPERDEKPLIQIAILLDTSNSMDGLIDQAKAQLWKIVNEFVAAKKNGVAPALQVALYEYGNNSLPPKEGYIRLVLQMTDDLDKVSRELFALTTNGGSEYCGQVIKVAVGALDWSTSSRDLKAIFIAGNEPFTQGGVDYRHACMGAVAKGITVSAIYCGPYNTGVNTKWADGAALADGDYMNIDQDRKVVHISAPQDKEIARLGVTINTTYIAYGTYAAGGQANQAEQDGNAGRYGWAGSNVQRAVSKSSRQYVNSSWDLVDALRETNVKLDDVKEKDLPEEMKKMTIDERKAYVKGKADERKSIQAKIQKLNEARKTYVAKELKKRAESGENTFDAAIIKALRRQAEAKGFQID
ncbi:MAG: VWA domain-containing protein [Planctomycetes bacterium]|nr:VWA domain-containing protein [Planctomycetota bacterium]